MAHLARALYMEVFDGWVVTGTGTAVACAAIVLCAAAGMAMTTPLGSVACTCAAIGTPGCAAMPTGQPGKPSCAGVNLCALR